MRLWIYSTCEFPAFATVSFILNSLFSSGNLELSLIEKSINIPEMSSESEDIFISKHPKTKLRIADASPKDDGLKEYDEGCILSQDDVTVEHKNAKKRSRVSDDDSSVSSDDEIMCKKKIKKYSEDVPFQPRKSLSSAVKKRREASMKMREKKAVPLETDSECESDNLLSDLNKSRKNEILEKQKSHKKIDDQAGEKSRSDYSSDSENMSKTKGESNEKCKNSDNDFDNVNLLSAASKEKDESLLKRNNSDSSSRKQDNSQSDEDSDVNTKTYNSRKMKIAKKFQSNNLETIKKKSFHVFTSDSESRSSDDKEKEEPEERREETIKKKSFHVFSSDSESRSSDDKEKEEPEERREETIKKKSFHVFSSDSESRSSDDKEKEENVNKSVKQFRKKGNNSKTNCVDSDSDQQLTKTKSSNKKKIEISSKASDNSKITSTNKITNISKKIANQKTTNIENSSDSDSFLEKINQSHSKENKNKFNNEHKSSSKKRSDSSNKIKRFSKAKKNIKDSSKDNQISDRKDHFDEVTSLKNRKYAKLLPSDSENQSDSCSEKISKGKNKEVHSKENTEDDEPSKENISSSSCSEYREIRNKRFANQRNLKSNTSSDEDRSAETNKSSKLKKKFTKETSLIGNLKDNSSDVETMYKSSNSDSQSDTEKNKKKNSKINTKKKSSEDSSADDNVSRKKGQPKKKVTKKNMPVNSNSEEDSGNLKNKIISEETISKKASKKCIEKPNRYSAPARGTDLNTNVKKNMVNVQKKNKSLEKEILDSGSNSDSGSDIFQNSTARDDAKKQIEGENSVSKQEISESDVSEGEVLEEEKIRNSKTSNHEMSDSAESRETDCDEIKKTSNDNTSEVKIANKTNFSSSESESDSKDKIAGKKKMGQSKMEIKIDNLKKYIRACGIRINNYATVWEGCKSDRQRADKLKKILEDNGMIGRPSLQKCKKLRAKIERAREIEELDLSNIIEDEENTSRYRTRTRRTSVEQKSHEKERMAAKKAAEIKQRFSRIKDLIDSDSRSSGED